MRHAPPRPLEEPLIPFRTLIICPITLHDSIMNLIFIWHRRSRIRKPLELRLQPWRRICHEPFEMLLARMALRGLEPKGVLIHKTQRHLTKPHVMRESRTRPHYTRMFRMVILIASVASGLANRRRGCHERSAPIHMLRSIQNLCRFKNHFHNMLVTMPPRTPPRISREEEDVHCRIVEYGCLKYGGCAPSIFSRCSAV